MQAKLIVRPLGVGTVFDTSTTADFCCFAGFLHALTASPHQTIQTF